MDTHVAISGATILNAVDKPTFTLQLTEAQKVTVQLFSATAGGDGTGYVFTPSNCSNNAAFHSQQPQCEDDADPGVGVFTPNRCDTVLGVPVSTDGTGFSFPFLHALEHLCLMCFKWHSRILQITRGCKIRNPSCGDK